MSKRQMPTCSTQSVRDPVSAPVGPGAAAMRHAAGQNGIDVHNVKEAEHGTNETQDLHTVSTEWSGDIKTTNLQFLLAVLCRYHSKTRYLGISKLTSQL